MKADLSVCWVYWHLVNLTTHRRNISLPGISYLFRFIALVVPVTRYSVLMSALSCVDSSVLANFAGFRELVSDTLSFTVTGLDEALDIPGRTISVDGFASDVSCKSTEDVVGLKELVLRLEEGVDNESVIVVSLEEAVDDESIIDVSLEEEIDDESVIDVSLEEELEDDDDRVSV